MFKKLYYAFVHSHLSYLAFIWGNTGKYILKTLVTFQNRVVKFILGLHRLTSTKVIYQISSIIPLTQNIKCNSVKFVFRSIKYSLHSVKLTKVHNFGYALRRNINLPIPSVNTTKYGLQGVLYTCLTSYNTLPNELKGIIDYELFKMKIKKYFLELFLAL